MFFTWFDPPLIEAWLSRTTHKGDRRALLHAELTAPVFDCSTQFTQRRAFPVRVCDVLERVQLIGPHRPHLLAPLPNEIRRGRLQVGLRWQLDRRRWGEAAPGALHHPARPRLPAEV